MKSCPFIEFFLFQEQLKTIVSNVMVIGDKRKHLAAIVTLR